ncbi:hypothetical protein Pyn_12852 [Prunus yedoensis var. nudiflora]|uniref:Uncharacterized protein n=1 Tax=Prunus yedoensis var. nudiflora TaxID=2094558 RepID=A0A314Y552_PRUYE|nr:hypothetical protein Pyn_12852 [Prunus yedoensis var. nudiflora]
MALGLLDSTQLDELQVRLVAAEKKKPLAERKLIRARWLADMHSGDIAWRRITCLIWGMFSEGI